LKIERKPAEVNLGFERADGSRCCLVGEVRSAGGISVSDRIEVLAELANLSAEVVRHSVQGIVRFPINVSLIDGDDQLGTNFASRRLGLAQVVDEQTRRAALETLSDVGHCRYCSPSHLVPESEVAPECSCIGDLVNTIRKIARTPPCRQLFEITN